MSSSSIQMRSVHRTAVGIVLALVGFVIYVWFVGATDIVEALGAISWRHIVSLVVLGLVPLVVWGVGLWLVLRRVGVNVGLWDSAVLFAATGFINAVTPFGQSGGTPVSSLLVAWECGIDYEDAFAAAVSLNVIVRLSSLALGVLAVVGYSLRLVTVQGIPDSVTFVAAATVMLLVAGGGLWIQRHELEPVVGGVLGRVASWLGRLIPGLASPNPEDVASRVEQFVSALDVLASDPWRLLAVFALATFGQLSVAAALWTALDALGVTQPLGALLVVIPLAKVSGVLPTPGGLGSAEVVLSGLLMAVTGISGSLATAATLVYRGTVYWVPTLLGAVATGGLLVSARGTAETRQTRQATAVAFVLAGSISIALILVVHTGTFFVEPTDAIVHFVRDIGLGVLGFAVLWTLFTTVTTR